MADDNIQHGIDDNPHGDAEKGAALGGVGGAAVGAAAGAIAGPAGMLVGAAIGGIAGAVASGVAVAAVDSVDNDDTVSGIGDGSTRDANDTLDDNMEATTNIMPDTHAAMAPAGGTTMGTHNRGNTNLDTDLDNDLDVNLTSNTNRTTDTTQNLQEGQTRIPVVEEELQVGKREVQQGGVRVTSNVSEVPVQEQVNLREEHVTVDRHRVDRPATDADFQAAQGTMMEITETVEQPVVAKQARVVEEVVVGKETTQHTQTIQDTVRHTDVNVEQLRFEDMDHQFQSNFQSNYGNRGGSYDNFQPAYRHGFDLAQDNQHASHNDWSTLEPHAQSSWSQRNSGNWDDYKDAVRHGWESVKNRR